ncbi:MAG: tetratricopeptide repeat protein [Oligoflexia bacterium]|nr:tetratricopeptide repeat protein [Oligoflexia bacterium]
MKRASGIVLAGVFLVFAVGCGSAQKRAQEFMAHEQYEEAARVYERILSRKPGDPEAAAGLAEARQGILGKRLIDVRKARTSGNAADAATLLLEIIAQERSWNIRPKGAAIFTQEEETAAAASFVLEALRESLKAEKPLRAEADLRRYEPLFQEKRAAEFGDLRLKVIRQGKAECQRFAKENYGGKPYAGEFVLRFCAFWDESPRLAGHQPGEKVRSLVQAVAVSGSVENLPQDLQLLIHDSLNASLKSGPWYSPEGKLPLEIALKGSWVLDEQRIPIQLVHSYQEDEKYVAYEDVSKQRQVPYEAVETVVKPGGGIETVARVKYRTESYTEKAPVERTRSVERSFPYGAWKITQRLRLGLEGSGRLMERAIQLRLSDESRAEDTLSEIHNPAIGLKPKPAAAIPDKIQWVKERESRFGRELASQLGTIWNEQYCGELPEGGQAFIARIDRAYQCLKLPSAQAAPPRWIQDFYQVRFGLGYREAEELLRTPGVRKK